MIDQTNTFLRKIPAAVIYVLALCPVPYLLWLAQTGGLGREPIRGLEHALGELALQFLVAGLCITPLRRHVGLNLLKFRRAIGVVAFTYVTLHLLVWLVLDVGVVGQVWADILKRPYITIGMVSFVALLPLALTSNNWSVRRLGARWRKLHRLTHVAVLLGGVHYVMLTKTWAVEPFVYLIAILGLLALRLPKRRLAQVG
ncbi:protein-methionine-sulfoxide reductase heme-binding subunit MsrQ [Roseobacter sp.]|uniref:protein-methionine-sulfoxide reductase heme-binding subunit MsrQ n=1 Tax=Roseobacter sp. TaxID=1907202 RepID=UPI0032974876